MDKLNDSADTFVTKGANLGGIYPFRVGEVSTQNLQFSNFILSDFSDRFSFREIKRQMYGPEQKWLEPEHTFLLDAPIKRLTLSNGRELTQVHYKGYISLYRLGFATVIFWIDVGEHEFVLSELIEMAALVRGTGERMDNTRKPIITIEWKKQDKNIDNFVQVCEMIEAEFASVTQIKNDGVMVQFVHPIIYANMAKNCISASEIREKYEPVIAGLANLWMDFETAMLKDDEVERILTTDFHPFEYGVTCLSANCTVEVHGKLMEDAAEKYRLSMKEMHFQEKFMLAMQVEVPVAQYYIMRVFDDELMVLQEQMRSVRYIQLINPLYVFSLVYRLLLLTRIHNTLMSSINQFRHVYLTRKSYINYCFGLYRRAFGTSDIESSIDQRLSTVENHLNSMYSMITTILVTFLTIVGTIFALVQAYGVLRDLGIFR